MSFYQQVVAIGTKFIQKHTLFKYGFNLSPMYRRTTARIVNVSEDLMKVQIKLPINYKNRNYVGSIFGGSMFSALDPIPMIQLTNKNQDKIFCEVSKVIYAADKEFYKEKVKKKQQ